MALSNSWNISLKNNFTIDIGANYATKASLKKDNTIDIYNSMMNMRILI
jgi:hypothetical protein